MITRVLLASCVLAIVACQDTSAPAVSNLPTKPETFFATPRTAEIVLEWRDNADNETRYRVEVSSEGGPWLLLVETPANTTTARHPNVLHGITYSYRVAACNDTGCSDWALAATKWQTGTAPVIVSFTVSSVGAYTATLRTVAQTSGLTTRFWYVIYREGSPTPLLITDRIGGSESSGPQIIENSAPTSSSGYTLINLDPLTQYSVFAYAENVLGQSTTAEPKVFATTAAAPPSVSGMELFINPVGTHYVRATIRPNGLPTAFRIEVIRAGESFAQPWVTSTGVVQIGTSVLVTSNFLIVVKGTTYQWRIVAANSAGSVTSETATFTVQ